MSRMLTGVSPNRRTRRVLECTKVPGEPNLLKFWMRPPGKMSGLVLYAGRAEVDAWMKQSAAVLEQAGKASQSGLSRLRLKDFALFHDLTWERHGAVNVIVGRNDTGKSHLLKILYCLAKSFEGPPNSNLPMGAEQWHNAIENKLRGVFQTGRLDQLIQVREKRTRILATVHGQECDFSIEGDATSSSIFGMKRTDASVIFIPPKELLTAFDAIAATRERLEIDGFDDTYYDLIRAMRLPPTRGKLHNELARVLESLESLFGGVIAKSEGSDRFVFARGDHTFSMPQTAEGIKKVGILTTLIHNRTLSPGSILFFDEPETNLHPTYITALMTMLMDLAAAGVQIYMATHSYFVIKQLHILAKERRSSVVFCSLERRGESADATLSDLLDGMPDNPIIAEAIAMYEREVSIDLKR